jgi:hypothetical protein
MGDICFSARDGRYNCPINIIDNSDGFQSHSSTQSLHMTASAKQKLYEDTESLLSENE